MNSLNWSLNPNPIFKAKRSKVYHTFSFFLINPIFQNLGKFAGSLCSQRRRYKSWQCLLHWHSYTKDKNLSWILNKWIDRTQKRIFIISSSCRLYWLSNPIDHRLNSSISLFLQLVFVFLFLQLSLKLWILRFSKAVFKEKRRRKESRFCTLV